MHTCSIQKLGLTILLILGQFLGTLHAAEYGSALHFHNDVACVAMLNEDEDDGAITLSVPLMLAVPWNTSYPSSACKNVTLPNRGVWPPHTGPPLNM